MSNPNDVEPTGVIAARQQLARILLEREVGQRLPSTQLLQQETGLGAGTVVKALRELQSLKAATLKARGHQGTTIEARHVGRLWSAAGLGTFVLVLPPPGPIEQQATHTAVRTALSKILIASQVEYLRGAARRLEEVYQGRANAALMSAGAYRHLLGTRPGIVGVNLGPGSYYADRSLVLVRRAGVELGPIPRVAIDRSSVDHTTITEATFGDIKTEPVDCPFIEVPARVLAGEVDTGIWHAMPTVIPPHLAGLELTPLEDLGVQLPHEDLHAVIVSMGVDAATNAALRELRPGEVQKRYRELMANLDLASMSDLTWPR
ncbi:YhfZ family protein [Sphaerimonospora cavernae]|uniref:YhfZ family protein n=1 Tax=Sphaerimonospora cavernae TaxID=1740611 RepID=A0ABV6U191_9ACTN